MHINVKYIIYHIKIILHVNKILFLAAFALKEITFGRSDIRYLYAITIVIYNE